MNLDFCLQIACDDAPVPDKAEFRHWLELALSDKLSKASLSIRIVDAQESASLNRQYRGKDKPTNVLSFPSEHYQAHGLPAEIAAEIAMELGDLVICAPIVITEASLQNKLVADHWAHLVIHGCLHLLGYDHIDNQEAEIMESMEIKLLARLDIANPYN